MAAFLLPLWAQVTVVGVAAAAGLSSGWVARGYLEDSKDLKALQAAQEERDAYRVQLHDMSVLYERSLAKLTEEKDVALRNASRIIRRPIYATECIDDDGMRELRQAITGTGAFATESDGTVPAAPAAAGQDRR